MAIDFPSTPIIGQQISQGGTTWQWDGVGWNIVPVMAAAFASDTPPANPADNQQWWRSTNGQLYFYYNDGNSKQWVQAAGGVAGDGYLVKTARSRNLVINGAMLLGQENGFVAGSIANYYPADQWVSAFVGPVQSVGMVQSLTPAGSPTRIRKTVTTPKASLAAGDYSTLLQAIEGTRMAGLAFGNAAAVQLVLRFGFKGPAGTYSFSLRNGTTRSYVKNFTITAGQANTDTVQVFVIPGDVTGAWAGDNTIGLWLGVTDAAGSTSLGVEGWQAGNFTSTTANSNMVATNGNIIELFDVGLYADPDKTAVPPPYEIEDYNDTLRDCSRYYQEALVHGQQGTPGFFIVPWYMQEIMRTAPTLVVISAGTAANAVASGDAVADNKSGYFQLQTTANSGSLLYRKYRLNARM
jgi:hypothetical protein